MGPDVSEEEREPGGSVFVQPRTNTTVRLGE